MAGLKIGGKLAGLVVVSVAALAAVLAAGLLGWSVWVSVAVVLVALVAVIALAASVSGSAKAYTAGAADALKKMAKGSLAPMTQSSEQDELAAALAALNNEVKKFTDDLSLMAKKFTEGGMASPSEVKSYEGLFKEAFTNVDAAFTAGLKDTSTYAETLTQIAKGEFRNTLAKQNGSKEKIYTAVDAVIYNLKSLFSEIQNIKQAASDGKLSYKNESLRLEGEWSRAAAGLCDVLAAFNAPVKELQTVSERLRRGEWNAAINPVYKGEYTAIFQALEQAAGAVSNHNKELLTVLEDFARYTPGRTSTRDYGGAFVPFKQAVPAAYENIKAITAAEKPAAKTVTERKFTPAATAPRAVPAVSKPAPAGSFTDAKPNLGNRTVKAPSAAKVYDAKDFGKY